MRPYKVHHSLPEVNSNVSRDLNDRRIYYPLRVIFLFSDKILGSEHKNYSRYTWSSVETQIVPCRFGCIVFTKIAIMSSFSFMGIGYADTLLQTLFFTQGLTIFLGPDLSCLGVYVPYVVGTKNVSLFFGP